MNMQVSYDSIIKACEIAALQIPIVHIDAMLRRDLPMDNRLKVILKKVASGEVIEPLKDEPLRAAGAGRACRDVRSRARQPALPHRGARHAGRRAGEGRCQCHAGRGAGALCQGAVPLYRAVRDPVRGAGERDCSSAIAVR